MSKCKIMFTEGRLLGEVLTSTQHVQEDILNVSE